MTAQQLKNSILQMAVSGKLVPQDPNDEPASVLLERIKAEKQELIKAGKIKRDKISSEIFRGTSRNIPYTLPDNWVWCKLNDIASLITKGTTPRGGKVAYLDNGIGFLRAENVDGIDKLNCNDMKYIDKDTHDGFLKRSILEENDILITIAGTLGRTAIVKKNDLPLNANQAVSIVRIVNNVDINLLYLIYAINSPFIQKKLTEQKKITAIPNLTLEIIANCYLPLPPLPEQHRIVSKIEELLPHIERYEQAETQLNELNNNFPELLKKSILQEAVQGKLVPQDPNDEPASALLERIRAEKQALIKAGKIKKDKHESVIVTRDKIPYEIVDGKERCIADEVPFEIPESWCWCWLGTIFQHNTGKALNSSNYQGIKMQYITTSNLYWDRFELDKLKEMPFTESEIEKCTVSKGDLLVCEGGDIGRAAIWNYDYPMRIQNHIHKLRPYSYVKMYFFYYVFYLYKHTGLIGGKGIGIQGLSSNALDSLCIPLPPLLEQQRIVKKIEELVPIINTLSK